MNKEVKYLLTCLGEGCAEIIKLTSKSIRFGLDNIKPNSDTLSTNRERLNHEINDLYAILQLLHSAYNEDIGNLNNELCSEKIKNLLKYMEISKENGLL